MNMIRLFIVVVVCCCQQACAQTKTTVVPSAVPDSTTSTNNFKDARFIPGNFNALYVDVLDNMYVITPTQQLKKIGPKGDSISVYNNVKKYGNPSLIDVTNPLKILIYYKNYATVNFLDRLLTFRSSLNLRTAGIFQTSSVATSYDNHFWLFDEQDFKLKKINEEGKLLIQSNDLRNEINEAPEIVSIFDYENFVYAYAPENGFYIFDYYGAYKNKVELKNWEHVGVQSNILYGFSKDVLHTFDLKTRTEKNYALPVLFKNNISLSVQNGKLYLLNKEGIYIYKLM